MRSCHALTGKHSVSGTVNEVQMPAPFLKLGIKLNWGKIISYGRQFMAFIDVVEWEPQSNDIFAYKFPNNNLSTSTQLIVHESQEAVLFSKGQLMGKFGPGKHTLTTENLPILRNLYGIPFGGKNPFMAELWFVNKTAPLNIDWKTASMRFLDPDYGQMIPITAKGRYGLKVKDAEKFLVQLVGTMTSFTSAELTDHFMGMLISKTNSSIISFMNANRVGINQIAMYMDDLSTFLKEPMAEFWATYGFDLVGFFITEVNLDTTTEEGRKISDALSDRSAQAIAGYTWQQKQSFDVANNAVNNGSTMGILGAAMMTGAFANNSNMGSAVMQTPGPNQYQMPVQQNARGFSQQAKARAEVFCSKCGKKYSTSSRFCPFCGDVYSPCPICGADNDESATRCVSCGAALSNNNVVGDVCGKCGAAIQPGTKFCPSCGAKL